jgi:APA family basic amino acid/polyamine antiporter
MSSNGPLPLLRVLGTAFGLAVVIGGTIGQGIMRTPGVVAGGVPVAGAILALWLAGGLFTLLDAMSSVELAASIRKSGGPYAFTTRAFGGPVGLAVGMTDWFANSASIAYIAVVFAEYCHRLGVATSLPNGLLGPLLPIAACAIQLLGTRIGGLSQQIGSAIKALAYGALILVLLAWAPATPPATAAAATTALTGAGIAAAMLAVTGAYGNWNSGVYFIEELKNPAQTIVRATFAGIAAIMLVYLLMNVALLRAMTPAELAGSNLVAADAAARVFGGASWWAGKGITIISLLSVITLANVVTMQFPRILFAIARDADVPLLSKVADNGAPRAAMLVTCGLAALLATIGIYEVLLNFALVLIATLNAFVNAAAILMRWREPALERPWRMPLFPLPALVALLGNGALALTFAIAAPKIAASAFSGLAVVTASLWLAIRHRRKRLATS